jgi:RNA polymerase sigma-70 factor (ECF subfamily)
MTMPSVAGDGRCLPASSCDGEAELVARLRMGDDDAYDELFRVHGRAMHAVARRFLGDTDDAAEAVQEALVSAFRAMGRFQGTSRLRTWLHRIVVNACFMKLRARKRNRCVPLEDGLPAPTNQLDTANRAEAANRVRASINRLPEAYRTVIRLRDLEGLDTEETATMLGTSTGVIKTRLHRARHALRTLLEPEFGCCD